jgi:hypothetical protein
MISGMICKANKMLHVADGAFKQFAHADCLLLHNTNMFPRGQVAATF